MLKRLSRTLVTVAALSALVMVSQAGAANKLEVKGTDGTTTKFAVADTGNVTSGALYSDVVNSKVGMGTTNPTTTLHVASEDGGNPLRGLTNSQHNSGPQGAVINFVKSEGSLSNPAVLVSGDYIGAFTAQYWNGTAYDRSAQFNFRTEGTVGAGSAPTAIVFQTGDKAVNLKEVIRFTSLQNVVAGNLGASATGDMATTATNGFLYIPSVAGALTTCSTVTNHTGHVPVWFDMANSKICTCQAGVLKCTAALN